MHVGFKAVHDKKRLRGKRVVGGGTTSESNTLRRVVSRRDDGEDYKAFLKRVVAERGANSPADGEARRSKEKRKKASYEE